MPSKKYNNGRRKEKGEGDNEIIGIVLVIISAFILLCIVIPPVLGFISRGIFNVTIGVFGLFCYPLFLSLLLWGIALIQGRSANVSLRAKIGIACCIVSLLLILQLATTHAHLSDAFSAYIPYVYKHVTAGGVLFGVVAYGIQAVTTAPVSYILYSLAFVCSLVFFFLLPVYNARKNGRGATSESQEINPFVKGLAAPQRTKPLGDTSLFVDTIRPVQAAQNEPLPEITEGNSRAPKGGVQFAPYTTEKSTTHEGFKSEAHKILFGDQQKKYVTDIPSAPKIDYAREQDDYMRGYTLPPLTSAPDIIDRTAPAPQPTPVAEPPAKPQKRVHISDIPGLSEIPLLPEKDYSHQIVDGSGIINGDDLSRKLAESMAPMQQKETVEPLKTERFSTDKIELTAMRLKDTAEKEDSRPSIVNGDYFGMSNKPQSKEQPAIENAAHATEKSTDEFTAFRPLTPFTEKQPEEESIEPRQEPIIRGSTYTEETAESRFLAQLNEDRKRAEKAAEKPQVSVREDLFASTEPFPDPLQAEAENSRLIAEDMPEQPRNSAFRIEEEPIDLSEKSHFDGEDNTGYYDSVSVKTIQPVSKQSVLRSENQMKIDDYVAAAPTPASKPKKKKRARYNAPSIDMLIASDNAIPEDFNVACEEKARMLESTLQELKLPVKVTGITRGPAVTRFELEMPPGIPIKRIEQFSTDIEYYLASNGKIRIEAPIPGKRAVGIEVPNEEIDLVRLREIIESKEFQTSSSPLTLSLGKDIAGTNIICNLEKMPHLLIAGATGSGKSACLNSIIISILYKASPDDVRMILIDPKRVEFNMYQGIPHLMGAEIINDAQQAINVLTWAKEEMDRRYTLFGTYRVRNLPEFNKSDAVKSGEEQKLPYIVLIVDELAELMLDNNRKVLEGKIMSIAQKARAAGIHLILATQRPSVDVITGTIKANLPSRIAFSVKSIVDSRTILDQCGAETLLGRGDMLYSPVGMDDPKRVQGAFVTDKEVLAVTEFVRDNNEADFDEEFTAAIVKRNDEPEADEDGGEEDKEFDNLMPDVLKCVIESGSASTSMIQRRFSVGYARASRIIDQMEMHKFIGPLDGSKPRAVYISREQYKELFGIDL